MAASNFFSYSLDLDAITNYCRVKPNNEEHSTKKTNEYRQQEITNSYELNESSNDLTLSQKMVREVITPQEAPIYDEVKVDFIRTLLDTILDGMKIDASEKAIFPLSTLLSMETFE